MTHTQHTQEDTTMTAQRTDFAADLAYEIDNVGQHLSSTLTMDEMHDDQTDVKWMQLLNRLDPVFAEAMLEKLMQSTNEYHAYFDDDAPCPG